MKAGITNLAAVAATVVSMAVGSVGVRAAEKDIVDTAVAAGTVENLLKPENRDKLRRVLTYHVVPGTVRAADVVKLQSAKAVSGDTITIKVADGKVNVDAANVTRTDIQASNGVIHVIDTVILPKGL